MKPAVVVVVVVTLLAASAAHGYACVDPADREGRRWFQTDPCVPPMVHDPLPDVPLIREEPRLPAGAGFDSAGSSWQFAGFDERGRRLGYWVERGRAVPFVSTDVVRVNRGPRGGRRWR